MAAGEIVTLEADGIRLAGQLCLPSEGNRPLYPTVCVCHGIPARLPDPSDRGYPLLAERICQEGFAVLIFNFRGTGASHGNLDMLGWTRDLKAVINYLWALPWVDRSHLSLMGFSGGAAVSVYVGSQDKRVSYIAACACPAEFKFPVVDEAQTLVDHFRGLGAIRDQGFPYSAEEWLGGFREISPIRYVSEIAPRPLLLVHGSQDELVPVADAHKLYAGAGEPKRLVVVQGAGHRLRQDEQAMTIVIDWLKAQAQIN